MRTLERGNEPGIMEEENKKRMENENFERVKEHNNGRISRREQWRNETEGEIHEKYD